MTQDIQERKGRNRTSPWMGSGSIQQRSRSLSPSRYHIKSSSVHESSDDSGSPGRSSPRGQKHWLSNVSKTKEEDAAPSSWAASWLLTPTMGRLHHSQDLSKTSGRGRDHALFRKPPVLVLVLEKLNARVKLFCERLVDTAPENAALAIRGLLLDDDEGELLQAMAASSAPSSPASPANTSPGNSNTMGRRDRGSRVQEKEWAKYTAPFLLLAGGETLYMDLEHHMFSLDALYQSTAQGFLEVKRALCDPLLVQDNESPELDVRPTNENVGIVMIAKSLAKTLDALLFICQRRRELMSLQEQDLFSSNPAFESYRGSCEELLHQAPKGGNGDASALLDRFHTELNTWIRLMDVLINLKFCRFTDTILSAHKLKALLESYPLSAHQRWLNHCLQRIKAVTTLYFDRASRMEQDLYGFDARKIASQDQQTTEMEGAIAEFLRKQDSGTSMMVCVVLDAFSAGRGQKNETGTITIQSDGDGKQIARDQWPALYVRQSTPPMSIISPRRGPQNATQSILPNTRTQRAAIDVRKNIQRPGTRTSSFKPGSSTSERSSLSSNRSVSSVGLTTADSKSFMPTSNSSDEWPWSEWQDLSLHFLEEKQFPVSDITADSVRTYKPEGREQIDGNVELSPVPSDNHNATGWPSLSSQEKRRQGSAQLMATTTLCTIRLGELSWLAVVFKEEEDDDSRWNLRLKRGHSAKTEEIHEFMLELAQKLRLSSLFQLDFVLEAVQKAGQPKSELCRLVEPLLTLDEFTATESLEFVRLIKEAYNLLPEHSNTFTDFDFVSTDSALDFFLGSDLRQLFPKP